MENENPLVSVIVVNFNGRKYLQKCFDSLLEGDYKNIELIFVDNGSGDCSIDYMKENFPQVVIVDNKANLGLAVASNKGAMAASGEYLFFYNNDTIADKALVASLVKKMAGDREIGVCGCVTYTYDGKDIINCGVACDILGYPYAKGKPFYVDAAIFIRHDLFTRMGGFDEKMFLYGEDRDICWRCWLYGYKVEVAQDAKFYHDSACITSDVRAYRTNIDKRFWSEFNSLRAILKNYSLFFLFFILPAYVLINISEIIIFFVTARFGVIKDAYLKSYSENLRLWDDTLLLRKKVQAERRISDFELMRHLGFISGKLRLFFTAGIPKFNRNYSYGKQ